MLKDLKECLKNEKQDKTILDIVLFGSSVKGKMNPRDIDIAVIFKTGSLRERIDKAHKIKEKIRKLINIKKELDVKGILWEELFEVAFFGRVGIFLEGISLFDEEPFSYKIGFKAYSLFTHALENKSHTEKVKFNYILAGRAGMKGILKELNGERLVNGAVKIPIEKSIEFEEVLKLNKITYKKKDILEAI